MKYKTVKLTEKMLNTIGHCIDICYSDYCSNVEDMSKAPAYVKRMVKDLQIVERALLKVK